MFGWVWLLDVGGLGKFGWGSLYLAGFGWVLAGFGWIWLGLAAGFG